MTVERANKTLTRTTPAQVCPRTTDSRGCVKPWLSVRGRDLRVNAFWYAIRGTRPSHAIESVQLSSNISARDPWITRNLEVRDAVFPS